MTPDELRAGVEALLADVSGQWELAHREEVRVWIDRVEYRMALETLAGVLQEERYPLTAAQRDRLKALADKAKCDPRTYDVDWLVGR
jgi:hypothetical protein